MHEDSVFVQHIVFRYIKRECQKLASLGESDNEKRSATLLDMFLCLPWLKNRRQPELLTAYNTRHSK